MFKRTKISQAVGLALSSVIASAATPAMAQDTTQRIEVTGSAAKRMIESEALPVTVVTKEEIAKTGATTAAELLEIVTANNGGGYNQSLGIGDSARPGFAGASLRGLGSNTTLVLLNGRRLAVYAFGGDGTDLNAIALGAIERVEVLRDGASALYGTDAIAGVINFITRKDYQGIDATVQGRWPQGKGGNARNASITGGWGDLSTNGFNIFGNLTYDKADALKAADRDFAKTAYLPNAPGGKIDRTSGNTYPASIFVPDVGTVNPGSVAGCLPPTSFQTTPTGACRFDYASVIDILPPQEKIGGLLRGTLALGANHELYGEYNRTQTTTKFVSSPTPASSATTFYGNPLLYPAGGKWYPQAVDPADGQTKPGLLWYTPDTTDGTATYFQPLSGDLDIFWRTVDAGGRSNEAVADQGRLLIGAKGTVFKSWDYDVGLMKAVSEVKESYVGGHFSETRLTNATCSDTSTPCGPLNPTFTPGKMNPAINPFGPQDADGAAALKAVQVLEQVRISKSTSTSIDGKMSSEIMQLPAGPLSVAFGGEHRNETYKDTPLAVLQTGDIIAGGGNQAAIEGERDVTAVWAEMNIPIIKNLDGLVQLRHDRYSDFGNTTNPKFGLRWAATPQIVFRGSYSTGFRAPTLDNLLQPLTQTNTGDSYNDPYYEATVGDCYDNAGNETANFNPKYCNAQLTVKQGGNPNVKPEESQQLQFGLVFTPMKDLQVSVDLFKIKMEKQLGYPGADDNLSGFITPLLADPNAGYDPTSAKLTDAAKASLRAGTVTDPTVFAKAGNGELDYVTNLLSNISTSNVTGADIQLAWTVLRNDYGNFRATLDSSYIAKWEQNGVDYVGKYGLFGPVVEWKHYVRGDWERGPWSAGLGYRYQSGYEDSDGSRQVGSYGLWDFSMAYRDIKNLTLRFGIDNLLDTDPPFTRSTDYFHMGYDPTYGNPLGRTYRVSAQFTWK
jgi:iron complex outermembrane receptor protein